AAALPRRPLPPPRGDARADAPARAALADRRVVGAERRVPAPRLRVVPACGSASARRARSAARPLRTVPHPRAALRRELRPVRRRRRRVERSAARRLLAPGRPLEREGACARRGARRARDRRALAAPRALTSSVRFTDLFEALRQPLKSCGALVDLQPGWTR